MGSSMVSCGFLTVLWSETSGSCLLRADKHSRSAVILVGILRYLHIEIRKLMFGDPSALPFSKWLYRMNGYTKTPVNTVWFDAIIAMALGLLSFAGTQAINAVFAISVTGLYTAYSIPIAARFLGENDFKPGPFNLGIFVS